MPHNFQFKNPGKKPTYFKFVWYLEPCVITETIEEFYICEEGSLP